MRDGDAPDTPAAKAVISGIDHLLLSLGPDSVRVTATPTDQDANSILHGDGGVRLP